MKLELSKRGDYGVRAILALARARGDTVNSPLIAAQTGVPVRFLPQILGDLARADMVASLPGRNGGYRLARPAETISLLAVIEAIEGDGRRRSCVLRAGPCGLDGRCDLHNVFSEAQDALLDRLAGVSLADLLGPGQPQPGAVATGTGAATR